MALEIPCPYCGTQMDAEQAHHRCPRCRHVEPRFDGAPLAACESGPAGSVRTGG
jgi:Zn finger protein HypA/HybF involved in hydrogenase expression